MHLMNYPKLIVLVRHGESEGNARGKDNESAEKPNHEFSLTERGKAQLGFTREILDKEFGSFDACFHSSYRRTHESARILFPWWKNFTEDSRLDEWWRGIWHSYGKEKVEAEYPAEAALEKFEGRYHHRPPGGESGPDVELRIRSFITDLRLFYENQRILIVGHGNWIILFQKIIEGLSVDEAVKRMKIHTVRNASIHSYIYEQGGLKRDMSCVPWENKI
jgi:broad specificity phosphatase PhoE